MTAAPAAVGVIGGGRMGAGIAQVFAAAGSSMTVVESDAQTAATARNRIADGLRQAAQRARLTEPVEHILARVSTAESVRDLAPHADLVVEAVPEDAALKIRLLTEVETVVSAQTVLASNTSSLSIADLAATLTRPGRFLGMHFFNPVPASGLVEIVVPDGTTPETVDRALGWTRCLGKKDIVVKDSPGFASSRLGVDWDLRPFA